MYFRRHERPGSCGAVRTQAWRETGGEFRDEFRETGIDDQTRFCLKDKLDGKDRFNREGLFRHEKRKEEINERAIRKNARPDGSNH